jgi:2,4-dienoyl-CoA reductase (NADPH2)
VVQLAQAIEAAGATIINSGIGWHEARIPTIATCVPRAGFAWVTQKLKGQVGIPLVATNRINTPDVAESPSRRGQVPTWCRWRGPSSPTRISCEGARRPWTPRINTCIACNQACLDHTFAASSRRAWSTRAPATRPSW